MSLLNVENIRTILEQKQTELSKVDQEYAKKLYSEKLFNNPANKKNMELGCEILAEKLKNISSVDIPYSYNSEIKHKLFSEEEYDKMKNVKYFYTNCRAMKDFVKSFNKIWSSVASIHVEQPFVNKISLDENKLKENKLHSELKFEQEYKHVYNSGFPRSYYENVAIHPSPDSIFFGFN